MLLTIGPGDEEEDEEEEERGIGTEEHYRLSPTAYPIGRVSNKDPKK